MISYGFHMRLMKTQILYFEKTLIFTTDKLAFVA